MSCLAGRIRSIGHRGMPARQAGALHENRHLQAIYDLKYTLNH